MPTAYRRRPLEVTAMRLLTKDDFGRAWVWINNNGGKASEAKSLFGGDDDTFLSIRTENGSMRAGVGDWIVKVGNSFVPLRPDIFTATYEEVTV